MPADLSAAVCGRLSSALPCLTPLIDPVGAPALPPQIPVQLPAGAAIALLAASLPGVAPQFEEGQPALLLHNATSLDSGGWGCGRKCGHWVGQPT